MPNSLFHLQFPPPEMAMGIVHNILFESLDNFEAFADPPATLTLVNGTAYLNNGESAGYCAYMRRYMGIPTELYTWDKKRTFRIKVIAFISDDTDTNCFVGLGNIQGFGQCIGFKFYPGIWSTGGLPTEVDLITGLTPPLDLTMSLKIVFSPGENIKFYIDDVLLATVDSDLPSDTNHAAFIFDSMVYAGTDALHKLSFCQLRFDQDL